MILKEFHEKISLYLSENPEQANLKVFLQGVNILDNLVIEKEYIKPYDFHIVEIYTEIDNDDDDDNEF